MQIPPWPQAGEREAELLRMVLDSPQWGGFHPFIEEFETSFAAYQQTRYGVAAMNGTVALEAMLEALGIGPGDEVIVPAISFVTTATAVSRVGAVPVFVDIGRDTYNLDAGRVAEALTPQTRAVMAVHFGGAMCDMDALTRLCDENEIMLLEDAAHAHGAEWDGKRAGSFGRAASFSFQNGKVLTAGEGGILLSSDDEFMEAARELINCGRRHGRSFYEHHRLGSNFRMTAFQAAVLLAQFERLPEQIARRTYSADLLRQETAGVRSGEIFWQSVPAKVTQNPWYLLMGRLKDGKAETRNRLVHQLHAKGIPATPFYPHVLYKNPLYRSCGCRVMPCPEAEARVRDAFWLSHRVLLADEETVRQVGALVRSALTEMKS